MTTSVSRLTRQRLALMPLVAVVLWFAAPAQATPSITAGTHELKANTPGQTIEIMTRGGDQVAGVNLYLQVGDGTAGPRITGIDLLDGTLFDGHETFGQFGIGHGVGTEPWKADHGTLLVSGTIAADEAVLAKVTLDTTGLFTGSWDLLLDPPTLGTTDFAGVETDLTNGTVSVPEPATAGMVALGLLGLLGRRGPPASARPTRDRRSARGTPPGTAASLSAS